MKRLMLALALASIIPLGGCTATVSVRPPKPGMVLVEGRWVHPPRANAVWVAGHWERRGLFHRVWIPGHWRY